METFSEWFIFNAKKALPSWIRKPFAPLYHYLLAFFGALKYQFPSRNLFVIGITGTKGKTTTCEMVNKILEEAGYQTALAGTLRFKIGKTEVRNLFKMTMPGRFFLQKFLRDAVTAGCTHAIIEMTSEGAKQFRHKFIYLDALIFTNLSPEHIESHGSFEKYLSAKLSIAHGLSSPFKKETFLVVNGDDPQSKFFLEESVQHKISFSLKNVSPYESARHKSFFTWKDLTILLKLPGVFNIYNAGLSATLANALGIEPATIKSALEKIEVVPGRAEFVTIPNFSDFEVVIDYAHTPDSLSAIYGAFPGREKVCVLGGTGGGRDTWKRPLMGKIAAENCKKIFLTDEDSYDEDPMDIIYDIKKGIDEKEKESISAAPSVEIEVDRRKAIEKAVFGAQKGNVIIITGKGTDPFIMGPNGSKLPWDDKTVAQEVLEEYVKKTRSSL
jgi:UDP-N-acetylmuramoyl-L-alanyl-D-glutamate--2,6-diaminopimelate ligase